LRSFITLWYVQSFSYILSFKRFSALTTGLTVAGGALIYALENSVHASNDVVHPHHLPWPHRGTFSSFDIASVRRGYEVYKQVCAACHSMKYIYYRHFVNTIMTEEEAKAEAADALISDVDDKGAPIKRPGILTDKLPDPYPNKKAAAAANSGAAPPDLSLMALARHGGDDYIFSLLTGYFDAPAGIKIDEGKAYNPYFPGGVISMPQQLFDEGIEYKDGTPATQSQQAKDIATFMHWCAEPYHDTRKRWALKITALSPFVAAVLIYGKRYIWTFKKSQKFIWTTVKGREPPTSS
uniref:Cytochrome c domain-containing protein n=1 Tax=Angiostrongylus cantonensis TaxID=6313 RepID=A0A158PC09_ANGCA